MKEVCRVRPDNIDPRVGRSGAMRPTASRQNAS